jgi:hypothetical protein
MTSTNSTARTRHTAPRSASPLSARDQAVVELVGRFRQLERRQIGALRFAGLASQTPLDRTLKRLVERQYLARLPRLVGAHGGGSAQYVYQLGRRGWKLLGKPGTYWPFRSANLHTLAIADCFVTLQAAAQQGQLTVIAFTPEPECHETVGGVLLTPDAYLEVGFRAFGSKVACFVEVDRGTEHADKIQGKCVRYWQAYQRWERETYPYVLFVVPDQERAGAIRHVVAGGPNEAQGLFLTATFKSFPQGLGEIAANGGE